MHHLYHDEPTEQLIVESSEQLDKIDKEDFVFLSQGPIGNNNERLLHEGPNKEDYLLQKPLCRNDHSYLMQDINYQHREPVNKDHDYLMVAKDHSYSSQQGMNYQHKDHLDTLDPHNKENVYVTVDNNLGFEEQSQTVGYPQHKDHHIFITQDTVNFHQKDQGISEGEDHLDTLESPHNKDHLYITQDMDYHHRHQHQQTEPHQYPPPSSAPPPSPMPPTSDPAYLSQGLYGVMGSQVSEEELLHQMSPPGGRGGGEDGPGGDGGETGGPEFDRTLQHMAMSTMGTPPPDNMDELDKSDGYFEAGYLVLASFWYV